MHYGKNARYHLIAESDSSEILMALRVTLLEYDTNSGAPPQVKRRLYLSSCRDCQVLLTNTQARLPVHCHQCSSKNHSFVNFQPMVADISLVPAKQTSMPLNEANSFLKVIAHTVEIRNFLVEEIKISLPTENCYFFLDSQAVILVCRTEPYSLSTRLRHVVAQIQIKLQENEFCLFKSLFYLDQRKIGFGIDAVTKQPKGKVDTQIRYLEKRLYTPEYLTVHPAEWHTFLSNTTLLPRLSQTDLTILEVNPSHYHHFLHKEELQKKANAHLTTQHTAAQILGALHTSRVGVMPIDSWDVIGNEQRAAGVFKHCSKTHRNNPHNHLHCQLHVNTLHTARVKPQGIPDKLAFEGLLQRKRSHCLAPRSAVHILARVLYFLHILRARVQARRDGKPHRPGNAHTSVSHKTMEMEGRCNVEPCHLPCSQDLQEYTEAFVAPLLYANLVQGQVYSIPQYMQALRELLYTMALHGYTRSYFLLASSLIFLILCCLHSHPFKTEKFACFDDEWCGLQVAIAQGSTHKPSSTDTNAGFTISTFVILEGEDIWSQTILLTVHNIILHQGEPHTPEALLAIAGVLVPHHRKHMARILTGCSQCRLARAAKQGKVASMGINIPHPTDLIGTFSLLDQACTTDFISFYSPVHGYRYWLVTVLHHSLFCDISYVPSYGTHHTLLTLIKLAQKYNITSFHFDAASQAQPIVTEISQMNQQTRDQIIAKQPGGVLRRLLAQRPAGKLHIPSLRVQMHLPRRHKTAGIAERRVGLCKQFLKKIQMDHDADQFDFDFVLQCAAAQLNNMTTFECNNSYIAPIHLRSLSAVKPITEPAHLTPRHTTALDLIVSARQRCAAAMLQHKLHLLATPASENALSCGVTAAQITTGSVCIDLSYLRTHHTLVGALCRVTHTQKSNKGCIVFNPQGKPRFSRRMYEDLSYVAGPLRDEKQQLLQIFNLPQVCVDLNRGSLPGVLLETADMQDSRTEKDMKDNLDKTDNTEGCQTSPERDHDPGPDPDANPDHPADPPIHRRGERERKSPRKFQDFVMF